MRPSRGRDLACVRGWRAAADGAPGERRALHVHPPASAAGRHKMALHCRCAIYSVQLPSKQMMSFGTSRGTTMMALSSRDLGAALAKASLGYRVHGQAVGRADWACHDEEGCRMKLVSAPVCWSDPRVAAAAWSYRGSAPSVRRYSDRDRGFGPEQTRTVKRFGPDVQRIFPSSRNPLDRCDV